MKKALLGFISCIILIATIFHTNLFPVHDIELDIIATKINEYIESVIEKNTVSNANSDTEDNIKYFINSHVFDADEECQIHFLNVGQADATLIVCNGKAMLIDAGSNDQGTYVQNYLQKLNITDLEYVIGTHPDEDHYGGLDVIITKFNCQNVLLSPFYKDTRTVQDVYSALKYKNIQNTEIVVGNVYALGNATFEILGPVREYDNANDSSIWVKLTYGDNTFLFAGDATEIAENDLLLTGKNICADVYKVSHHGSSSSTSELFLRTVNPTYAVISCGEHNEYGHPHAGTLNKLRQFGVQLYRTDEQGTIIVTSDGTNLTWNCPPTDSWKAGN